jgi:acetyl-CoA synthetase
MPGLLDVRRYPDVLRAFRWNALWELFDGDRDRLNLAHECVDRHAGHGTALRIKFDDGRSQTHSFQDLAAWSSRFAHLVTRRGVERGDRVAVMLDPSLPFYGAVFGAVKRGAIAVPLFTLFGPDGVAARVEDCRPKLLLVERDAPRWRAIFPGLDVLSVDDVARRLVDESDRYAPDTAANDLAVFQYTSGTTRARPAAIRHTHRSVVTLMVGALYGVGLERGDRYFCPSSPAWGHGLWHGTIAPLALGIPVGSYSGKFQGARVVEALREFEITNLAAAPTVFRMLRQAGLDAGAVRALRKVSFTGEPMDAGTFEWLEQTLGFRPCSMYGSTEVGVVVVNYPGFAGHEVRPGALGKPAPGWEVAVVGDDGAVLGPGQPGEISVRRKGEWFPLKDRGWIDADGYFHHSGRSDDVIISAGWTMSGVEIEEVLRKHPDVRDAAVVGIVDAERGHVPKAFVASDRRDAAFAGEIQEFVKARLSRHEYPRLVVVLDELPKTPAGKIDRNALRARSTRAASASDGETSSA